MDINLKNILLGILKKSILNSIFYLFQIQNGLVIHPVLSPFFFILILSQNYVRKSLKSLALYFLFVICFEVSTSLILKLGYIILEEKDHLTIIHLNNVKNIYK